MSQIIKPACFIDGQEFKEWVKYAKISAEVVNPCDDCSAEYEMKMKGQQRCHKLRVISTLNINSKSKELTSGMFL